MLNLSPNKVLQSIALSIIHPNDPSCRRTDCHSQIADYIRTHQVALNDKIVLLGGSKYVTHSVLLSHNNELIVDSFRNQGVEPESDKDNLEFHYRKNGQEVVLHPIDSITIGDFKKRFLERLPTFKDYVTGTQ